MKATPAPSASRSLAATTGGLLLGGSTTFLLNLAAGLRGFGEELRVLSLTDTNEHATDFTRLGVEVCAIEHTRMIYEDRLRAGYLQLAKWQPRAVLACLSSESFEMLRLVPPGVRRFGLIQSDNPEPYTNAARYAPWIDAMIGVSGTIRDKLRAMPAFAATPVHAIPYGIHFSEASARAGPRAGEPLRLIYVGRLIEEQKRVSRLIALARELHARAILARLTLVGGGPAEAEVRLQLTGLNTVTVLGFVPNARIAELLREHDAFVLLSDYEGLPLALLEAMGAGLVPIVSDLPSGIREAVPDEAGYRVPVGDVAAAVRAIETLARDSDRRELMATAASAHVREKFSARRMAAEYLALLGDPATTGAAWPADVAIPVPFGVNAFLFSSWRRMLRRWLKQRMASVSASSSRSM